MREKATTKAIAQKTTRLLGKNHVRITATAALFIAWLLGKEPPPDPTS